MTERLSAWGDIGSGFRAPTLNELYRQFRVGTVLTLPNDQLGPERLIGGEAGVSRAATRRVTLRTTWFDNRVTNPVSNVTLSTVGATVTQQRQNLGATRIWGVQSDLEYRVGTSWKVDGAYLYNHARVTDGGLANTALVGNVLPQVPTHRGSLRASYTNARYLSLTLGVQFLGAQFDDDQNIRVVPAWRWPMRGTDRRISRACPGTRWSISPRRTPSAGMSICSPARRICSTSNTSWAPCRQRSDRPASSTQACAFVFRRGKPGAPRPV